MKRSTTTVSDYASRVWNSDETGFCLRATSKKILARRGDRSVHEIGGASDHQFITVNVCGNATGIRLPPFIRGNICIIRGQRVGQQGRTMGLANLGGWRRLII